MSIVHNISILSIDSKSKKRTSNIVPFIVVNSDRNNGYYINRLVKQIRKNDLTEYGRYDKGVSLSNVEPNDILIFGESRDGDFDVRITADYREIENLDRRRFKENNIYDIIEDFDEVIAMLKQYEKRSTHRQKSRTFPVYVVTNFDCEVVYRPVVECWTKKKVTVFNYWVKVGTDVFDIYVDLFGNEFIKYKGQKLFIHTNWFGEKYLSTKAEI